jgi:hypothetical protein
MTINDALQDNSIRSAQLMQRGSLIFLAITASLMLGFRRHSGIVLGVTLALGCVVVPAAYVLARRILEKVRHRETEERLMLHTRTFQQSEEPVREAAVLPPCATETDIELLARAIDGTKLPLGGFRKFGGSITLLPEGEPVVFDALPRLYATRTISDRRFENLAATMPGAICTPLNEILYAPDTIDLGVVEYLEQLR